jgi:hypothetical protein
MVSKTPFALGTRADPHCAFYSFQIGAFAFQHVHVFFFIAFQGFDPLVVYFFPSSKLSTRNNSSPVLLRSGGFPVQLFF